MRRPEFIAEQSRRPSGALGWLIGKIMSHETESLNSAVLAALELQASERVLEIGFGHGKTLRKAAENVSEGLVAGVDFSETMLHMARRRCAPFLATGRVQLELADSTRLPFPDGHFDKAYSVHTLYFWKDPAAHLCEIHRVLRPGGRLVLGFRTKDEGSGAEAFPDAVYTFRGVDAVKNLLNVSGYRGAIVAADSGAGTGMVVLVAQRDSEG